MLDLFSGAQCFENAGYCPVTTFSQTLIVPTVNLEIEGLLKLINKYFLLPWEKKRFGAGQKSLSRSWRMQN